MMLKIFVGIFGSGSVIDYNKGEYGWRGVGRFNVVKFRNILDLEI